MPALQQTLLPEEYSEAPRSDGTPKDPLPALEQEEPQATPGARLAPALFGRSP